MIAGCRLRNSGLPASSCGTAIPNRFLIRLWAAFQVVFMFEGYPLLDELNS